MVKVVNNYPPSQIIRDYVFTWISVSSRSFLIPHKLSRVCKEDGCTNVEISPHGTQVLPLPALSLIPDTAPTTSALLSPPCRCFFLQNRTWNPPLSHAFCFFYLTSLVAIFYIEHQFTQPVMLLPLYGGRGRSAFVLQSSPHIIPYCHNYKDYFSIYWALTICQAGTLLKVHVLLSHISPIK